MSTRYRNLVDGEWIAGDEGPRNLNPSDLDDVVGVAPATSAELAVEAVHAAAAALPAWASTSIEQRSRILGRAGEEIHARRDELGTLLAREEGKPIIEAVGEVTRAAHLLTFFAGEALRRYTKATAIWSARELSISCLPEVSL